MAEASRRQMYEGPPYDQQVKDDWTPEKEKRRKKRKKKEEERRMKK